MASAAASAPLPEMPPLVQDNRNWQVGWAAKCNRLCCYTHPTADPCADIGCQSCSKSIVRPDGATTIDMKGMAPFTRYVCLDCPVDMRFEEEVWGTHFCEVCFASRQIPHFGADGNMHRRWLMITPTGEHIHVPSRPAVEGELVLKQIRADDLNRHAFDGAMDGQDCPACYGTNELSADNPPANLPGCVNPAHRCCVDGCLQALARAKRLDYVLTEDGLLPPSSYFCFACKEVEERQMTTGAVLRELEILMFDGADPATAVEVLKSKHVLQPRPGAEPVNAHLHDALDERLVELCGGS